MKSQYKKFQVQSILGLGPKYDYQTEDGRKNNDMNEQMMVEIKKTSLAAMSQHGSPDKAERGIS